MASIFTARLPPLHLPIPDASIAVSISTDASPSDRPSHFFFLSSDIALSPSTARCLRCAIGEGAALPSLPDKGSLSNFPAVNDVIQNQTWPGGGKCIVSCIMFYITLTPKMCVSCGMSAFFVCSDAAKLCAPFDRFMNGFIPGGRWEFGLTCFLLVLMCFCIKNIIFCCVPEFQLTIWLLTGLDNSKTQQ